MREIEFKTWMQTEKYSPNTVSTVLSDAKRLDRTYGDLDALYLDGGLVRLYQELAYSRDDERAGRENPAKFSMEGSLYDNLATYRRTIEYYRRFAESTSPERLAQAVSTHTPTNLILYGPPGTGKTFTTAEEAVRLCDGVVPDGRAAVVRRYEALRQEKRIGFVTFHQSYDYETFVEGLRPETSDQDGNGAGFRLEARPGLFREISALADHARLHPKGPDSADCGIALIGKRFWKMGQGAIGSEDDVYDKAIEGNYITLGWGGAVDWSAPQFSTQNAIKTEWLGRKPSDVSPSNWTQVHAFRSEMKTGDIVIVPYGNTAFRAVAEVIGDYYFDASAEGYYAHRRKVKWLLKLEDPLPLDTIVEGNFTMRTLYPLTAKRVYQTALARLLTSNQTTVPDTENPVAADQFVLIVDEINRANISKVFGELITLIEPDKRLGMPNAITLRLPYSKQEFGVPANLHIIGTMNTADRSIALLDTALRRRFQFREVAPDPSQLPADVDGVSLRRVLESINDRIEYLIDRDHRIGHAFFMGSGGDSRTSIDSTMRDKVIPLLQEYFFDDWSRLAAVLNELPERGGSFLECRMLPDPTGLGGELRPSWRVREEFAPDAYDRLVNKQGAPTT
ncbi:AAA domain-containing protein [Pigmentiphaga aceris]|uniref:AAA domain-containing protein n=1 Tax=Pigmentiphaga aceris TaxID=1940612 RepID=A0A5C0AW35_9BURK|nr:AAA family ATPase [Pigmentiphaga aceris]QEI06599.1 AAA domain-containing protein [Pigmentiphaga aceris]